MPTKSGSLSTATRCFFSDEAERVYQRDGLDAFTRHEAVHALKPLPPGPFKPLLEALHRLQAASGTAVPMRVRTGARDRAQRAGA
jgi:hypothetical protein